MTFTNKKHYPQSLCYVCGSKWGKPSGVATYHAGTCDLCNLNQYVTEARDFEPLNLPEEWGEKPKNEKIKKSQELMEDIKKTLGIN